MCQIFPGLSKDQRTYNAAPAGPLMHYAAWGKDEGVLAIVLVTDLEEGFGKYVPNFSWFVIIPPGEQLNKLVHIWNFHWKTVNGAVQENRYTTNRADIFRQF
jgi:hypothetical protein